MMTPLTISITTPIGTVYTGQAECITATTEEGILQIKPHHADFLGTIDFSHIRIDNEGTQDHLYARKGVIHVELQSNSVSVLVSDGNYYKHVDILTAEAHIKKIEDMLASGKNMSDFHVTFLTEEKIALEQMIHRKEM